MVSKEVICATYVVLSVIIIVFFIASFLRYRIINRRERHRVAVLLQIGNKLQFVHVSSSYFFRNTPVGTLILCVYRDEEVSDFIEKYPELAKGRLVDSESSGAVASSCLDVRYYRDKDRDTHGRTNKVATCQCEKYGIRCCHGNYSIDKMDISLKSSIRKDRMEELKVFSFKENM